MYIINYYHNNYSKVLAQYVHIRATIRTTQIAMVLARGSITLLNNKSCVLHRIENISTKSARDRKEDHKSR
jgi:hypothetical protein